MQDPHAPPYLGGHLNGAVGAHSSAGDSPSAAHPSESPADGDGDGVPGPSGPTAVDLAAELQVVQHELVPLSFIVERVVGQVYADLANLAEILPSTPEPIRKRIIVDYVLQTRRQILKLLVLVRWSSEAENVAKCMNIIGFLGRQNAEFDHAVESLTEVKTMLAGARVRNYDLPTAITVLTTGTYTGLPTILAESFAQPTTLPDEVVLRALEELDDVLRWRLNCVEVVPRRMRRYWIADGRVTFHVEGMWEASLTYGGSSEDEAAEWYLLSVKFLFRVKDARGVWSDIPVGPMKEHIVELCNRELAKRRPPPETEAAGDDVPDVPLVRGFAFLQRLALSYQIEALYTQALELSATLWTGTLRVDLSSDRQELKIEYWTPPASAALQKAVPASQAAKAAAALAIPPQGILTLSIRSSSDQPAPLPPTPVPPKSQSGAKVGPASTQPQPLGAMAPELDTAAARESALLRALARGESIRESPTDEATELAPERVHVAWAAGGLSEAKKASVRLDLDSDLSLESLLVRTTAAHARESTLQLYYQLLGELDSDDLEIVEPDSPGQPTPSPTSPSSDMSANFLMPAPIPSVRIHLHGQHHILASVNALSGKLEFRAVGEVAAMRETRLRAAAEKIDKDRKSAGDTLLRVRSSTIVDELESRAAFLGYRTTRRIAALRQTEWIKFGVGSRSFLFVYLPQLPEHYLALVLGEEGFRFALISVREVSEALQSFLVIDEIGWLDKSPSHGDWESAAPTPQLAGHERPAPFGSDVTVDDLRDLYQYCVRRIAYFKVEQQLHMRRIPYKPVASYSPKSTPSCSPDSPTPPSPAYPSHPSASQPKLLSSASPYLVIQSSDLLRSTARVAYPNIAIQCFLKDDVIRTTLHVRFRDLALVNPDPAELPSSMAYDPKTSVITFTSDDIDTCVPTFLTAYSLIARVIVLARSRASTAGGGAGGKVPADDVEVMEGIL